MRMGMGKENVLIFAVLPDMLMCAAPPRLASLPSASVIAKVPESAAIVKLDAPESLT